MRRSSPRLLVTAALTALTACAAERGCPDRWCGTLVIVTGAEADVLLPAVTSSNVAKELSELVFSRLADVGSDLNSLGDSGFVPLLAESWRFEDSLTLRVTLRSTARWHDGEPVRAADVAFTFDVHQDPRVNSPAAPRLRHIATVTARDSLTTVFRFREVYPEQLFDATYHMWILPRHLLDTVPRERLAAHPFGRRPVGSGPFRFVRWNAGQFVELAADSGYVLGRPGLRRIVWRFTPDLLTAFTQLLAGEADLLQVIPPRPEDLARVDSAPHLRAIPYRVPAYSYIGFNFRDPANPERPHPLFADRELRRALALAVDRQAVVRAVFGGFAEVPVGPLTRPLAIWSDTIPGLSFDSAGARRLLDRLGWRDADGDGIRERGRRRLQFELLVPTSSAGRVRSAQVIQDQLRRVGVAMQIAEVDFNVMLSRAGAGRFDAFFGGRQQDPSPASILEEWTADGIGSANYQRYVNPEVDRLVHQAMRIRDPAQARTLWHRAIAMINADAPAVWVYEPSVSAGVHTRLENVTIRPDLWTATVWTWRVDPTQLIARDRVGVN